MTNCFPENCGYTKNSCGIILCQLSDSPCSVVYEKQGECIKRNLKESDNCSPSCVYTNGYVYTSLPPMIFCKKSKEYYFIGDVCHCQNEEKDI